MTTEMLLTRALDAEMLELLVQEFVQRLLRVDRLTQQEMILDHILSTTSGLSPTWKVKRWMKEIPPSRVLKWWHQKFRREVVTHLIGSRSPKSPLFE